MLPPNLFTYFCKVEFTFSILLLIVDANKGKLRFYFDAPCLNAAEVLLPRHFYNASTPFLQRLHAILATLLRHSCNASTSFLQIQGVLASNTLTPAKQLKKLKES